MTEPENEKIVDKIFEAWNRHDRARQEWFWKAYPQGIVYEQDEDEPFDLKAMGADFVEVTYIMGIPYRLPKYIDGEITYKMVEKDEADESDS